MKHVLIVLLILVLLIVIFYILPRLSIITVPPSWVIITNYLNKYKPDIFIVILVAFMILVFIKDMHMEIKNPKKHINSILTVETFNNAAGSNVKNINAEDFCSIHEHNLHKLESHCNSLSTENCILPELSCCVIHKNKCVAGSALGPKFV